MVKMKKESNLQVTFSKRRYGLFKKASELCTLCGIDIGVIVFSPGRKVFSFGNPGIKSIISRYKNYDYNPLRLVEGGRNAAIQALNDQLTKEAEKHEVETKSKKVLDYIQTKREETMKWWEKPVNELDLTQTTQLISALKDLSKELTSQRFQKIEPQNYHGGSYSNIVGGDGNIGVFDQRRMVDVNAFNSNPNMIIPNRGPMFGYNHNHY